MIHFPALQTMRRMLEIAAVALAYYAAGDFSLLLMLTAIKTTPIWPSAGIALGAVLLWGYRVLPGVFLGELLVAAKLFGLGDAGAVIVGLTFGLQALLHAWSGAYLIRRTIGAGNPLFEDRAILTFTLLGGPVSAVIPALMTFAVLLLTGHIDVGQFTIGVFTWWLGSSIGVIIFTPLMLVLFAKPRAIWRKRAATVALPLCAIFTLVLLFFIYAQHKEDERMALVFEDAATKIESVITRELTAHTEILYSLKSYFEGSEEVTREEFRTFTQFALARHHGIGALEWIPRIEEAFREKFEAELGENAKITESGGNGPPIPAGRRSEYFPVGYMEPLTGNEAMLGFDVSSDPLLRSAQIRAITTGEISAAAPLKPFRGKEGKQTACLLYLPVYASQPDERTLQGLIAGEFRLADVVGEAMSRFGNTGVALSIRDVSDGGMPKMLYGAPLQREEDNRKNGYRLEKSTIFEMAGRRWAFEFAPSPDFVRIHGSWTLWWIFSAGLIFTGLSGTALLSITGHSAHLETEIAERTGDLRHSEKKYRQLVEGANSIILRWNTEGTILFCNRYALEFFGYREEEIIGCNVMGTIVPEVESETGRPLRKMIEDITRNPRRYIDNENENMRRDGSRVWIKWANRPIYGADGKLSEILSIGIDITGQKNAMQNLRKLSLAVEHGPNAVLITDVSGRIEYVNAKFTEITGYGLDEVTGKTPRLLKSDSIPQEVYREMWSTLLSGKEWRGLFHNRKKNGELYWAQQFISPVKNDAGRITHFVGIQEDVTEARKISEQMSFQASHDVLTGLINRREFNQCLKRVVRTAKENDSKHALCFLDLDRFKIVNDCCGHVAGDELLRQAGLLLREDLRKRDILARLGGDEFAILMEHCTVSQAERVATKIRDRLEQFRFQWEGRTFHIGVSIGITAITAESPDSIDLLNQADSACYAAKGAGRSRVRVYRKDDRTLAQRNGELHWVSQIHLALEENRFRLYVQPVVYLAEGNALAHYEVLLRLEETRGQIIPPDAFLPAAERYNLIPKIDRWVIDAAIGWISRHEAEMERSVRFAVNLSGFSLGDESLLGHIIQHFEKGPVKADRLLFDIKEIAAITHLADTGVFIKALRAYGCRFALDSFGGGLSSFAYLKNLAVDYLKIDGACIKGIEHDPVNLAMVKCINEIGHAMGLQAIAGSVETPKAITILKEMGIDMGQGPAFGKPLPIESLLPRKRESFV